MTIKHLVCSRRGWRVAAMVVTVAMTTGVAACGGIPSDDSPTLVARDAVPTELSKSSTTTAVPDNGLPEYVYVVFDPAGGSERLLQCPASIAREDAATTVGESMSVLEKLIALVPSESGCIASSINAVPPDLEILDAEVQDRILVLNLAKLTGVQGVAARRAIAQIVFTATGVPGIDGVRFRQDGENIAVNVSDGRTLSEGEAVYRSDFPDFQDVENTQPSSTTSATAPTTVPAVPPLGLPPVPAAPAP